LKKRLGVLSVVTVLVMALFALSTVASNAEMYFATDKNGQNRVTNVQEGTEVWIVIHDTDENIDCDVRDKFWTDIKIMDPKTGAYIVWVSYSVDELGAVPLGDTIGYAYDHVNYIPYKGHLPGRSAGSLNYDYMEETGADTGLFISKRSFTIGTRADFSLPEENTHVVDNSFRAVPLLDFPWDFQGGNYEYSAVPGSEGVRGAFGDNSNGAFIEASDVPGDYFSRAAFLPNPARDTATTEGQYLLGRFENMDTLVGLYQDQNDETDVATAMLKIIDTEATITWDQEIYKDANGSATIVVTDADENVNCNAVEFVPVWIIVNPGSWNPVDETQGWPSPNSFCTLKAVGGVNPVTGDVLIEPIRWYNIYYSGLVGLYPNNVQPTSDGAYYMHYPVPADLNVTSFDMTDETGFARVMFYAQETGVNTGVFQLNLNSILDDLGFNSLRVRDVLSAYYLDPNDEDDFKFDVAYIEEKMHSITSFTDATRQEKKLFWIGRDPVYVQVIDANANVDPCCPEQVVVEICDPHMEDDWEWLVLDETTSNSPVFFSNSGTELDPVWDAMGVGIDSANTGGYQLEIDNWKLEVFNEDDLMVRYNDVYYVVNEAVQTRSDIPWLGDLSGLGDGHWDVPQIDRIRVANDVSFDLMSIGDTQVYNGQTVTMYFLDRQGNRVSGYVNSDCVFIEVVDADQNEDTLRREKIDAFWDGGQNLPFGPWAERIFTCNIDPRVYHPFNALLGDTNIFNNGEFAKIYVLNPRSGFWAPMDLMETGVGTGDFVSVICVDLVTVYTCVPTLGALPGDTILAFYQDPSNHSDSAMISVKVGVGGGGTPPSQASTTTFTNATGVAVVNYTDADLVYVKVVDPSHAGATTLANAVTIGTVTYSLAPLAGAPNDTFITTGLDLNLTAGTSITATYKDPNDPTDTSTKTISVIASKLEVTSFYATPVPSAGDVTFAYKGSGIASVMSVTVYDLAGHLVWASELANVTKVVWNGKDDGGAFVANGAYRYFVTATDGTDTFKEDGTLFINR
jgi:hypothetical protein